MKRSTWLLSILAVTAFVATVATPPAEAACQSPIVFGTSGGYPYTNYVVNPVPSASDNSANGSLHIGRFWEPGKRNASPGLGQDEGAFSHAEPTGWWHQFTNNPVYPFYLGGQMDAASGVDNCPGVPPGQGGGAAADGGCSTTINATCPPGFPNELIIVLLDADSPPGPTGGDAYYYTLRPSFYLLNFPEFNMSPPATNACPGWGAGPAAPPPAGGFETFVMQPIPWTDVSQSTRVDSNTVSLDYTVADVAAGFKGFWDQNDDANDALDVPCSAKSPYATITGYRLCHFEGLADPGRLATAWTCNDLAATGPGGNSQLAFQVDCADVTPPIDNDHFLAIQLRFNGGPTAGGYDSEYVSRSTRVECDPNLAQPETFGPGRRPRVQQPTEGKPRLR